MTSEDTADILVGQRIKEIFRQAERIAKLHACLTSPRGDNFRLRLLQAMENPLDETGVSQLSLLSGVSEYHRHLQRLLQFRLVKPQEGEHKKLYGRTNVGEEAINTLREFERRVDKDVAKAIYSASLGPNSIRLFLRIYGDKREANWDRLQITYSPVEIGRLSLFLPRVIEGISAIDKLNEAGLLVYEDDDQIHMQPMKARSFYQYLLALLGIVNANLRS